MLVSPFGKVLTWNPGNPLQTSTRFWFLFALRSYDADHIRLERIVIIFNQAGACFARTSGPQLSFLPQGVGACSPSRRPKVQGQRQAVKVCDPFVPAAATSRRMEDWRLVRPWLSLRIKRNRDQGEFLCSRIFQSFGSWKLSSIALSILRCLNFYQTVIQKAVSCVTVQVDGGYRLSALGLDANNELKSFFHFRSQKEF